MISLIIAVAENGVIGKDNGMPWHLPADLAFFKRTTLHHTIIMGRKTAESIGKPLPHRLNRVVSRQNPTLPEGFHVFSSLESALADIPEEEEVFIIGGGNLYRYALEHHLADRIYLTEIQASPEGDTFFNRLPQGEWKKVSSELYPSDERNAHSMCFCIFERVKDKKTYGEEV